jgi:hypothetical protein
MYIAVIKKGPATSRTQVIFDWRGIFDQRSSPVDKKFLEEDLG